jgi:hypothetical protein
MEQISKNNGGIGVVYSTPFTLTPTTPVENEIKREWNAVQNIIQNGGREDPQNPTSWYTANEWMRIIRSYDLLGIPVDHQAVFASAILAKEYAVLRDLENQRLNGFRGGVYVLPDETKAAELIINLHRIPLAGIKIRTSRESHMNAGEYEAYEKEFIKTHGAKQKFDYTANGETTKIEGWKDTAKGVIYLSPEAYVIDLEAQPTTTAPAPGKPATAAPSGQATAAPRSATPPKTLEEIEKETRIIQAETKRAQAEAELRRAKQDAEKSRYRTYKERRGR